jgi:hypothetical protein
MRERMVLSLTTIRRRKMLTQDQIDEWNEGPDETPFWKAVKALTDEEREKLAELASESIKNAAHLILEELKRERGDV